MAGTTIAGTAGRQQIENCFIGGGAAPSFCALLAAVVTKYLPRQCTCRLIVPSTDRHSSLDPWRGEGKLRVVRVTWGA